ncbi:phage head morphogenesis protein [Hymenobacter sp. 15J16-1T3B]|uniref:phage head morphogenesis protein n=1 Tax=Hymenobacter sp. 15J16-1T3B TaxID=2886941 RepID=UPI001D114806|nr:phage minor head protein [Hymenobacter sp. 15J16-1T3B]MCC3159505.1 phage head morphogenesis protein [Hymenobacter sp. 15J16-1T3B]
MAAEDDTALRNALLDLSRQVHGAQGRRVPLHVGLLNATATKLQEAVSIGYNSPDEAATAFLRGNVQWFSAAKTAHQGEALTKLLLDAQGNVKPWQSFKAEALELHHQYNVRWLQAEYEHAIGSAQMAARWKEFEPTDLLSYHTVGDSRVRPEHRAWDAVVLPAAHEWWTTHYPPNGWLCRCTVTANPLGKATPAVLLPALPGPDDGFDGNVGQTGVIYPKGVPYYTELPAAAKREVDAVEGLHRVPELVTHAKKLTDARRDGLQAALNAINQVHLLPESPTSVKTLPIGFRKMARGTQGGFSFARLRDDPPPILSLNAEIDDAGEIGFTLLHELGHWIDYTYLDIPRDVTRLVFSSTDMKAVLDAAEDTELWQTYKLLLDDPKCSPARRAHINEYLKQPYEVWARAYSQYIAEQSDDERLFKALDRGRKHVIPDQWEDDDFAPVRDAMRELFVKKRWVPRTTSE